MGISLVHKWAQWASSGYVDGGRLSTIYPSRGRELAPAPWRGRGPGLALQGEEGQGGSGPAGREEGMALFQTGPPKREEAQPQWEGKDMWPSLNLVQWGEKGAWLGSRSRVGVAQPHR